MSKHFNITSIILPVLLISVLLCVIFNYHCYAKVWKDSFDEDLTGWEGIGRGARWEIVAGILFANIQCVEQPFCDEEYLASFLHWKIVEFDFEQLTMIGEEITYPQEGEDGMGELCLLLGKRQDEPDFSVEGYIVSPEEISRVTFSEKKDGYSRGKTKAWYGNIFKDTTRNLTVVFDTGHLQVWTSNRLITEFQDDNFKTIDIVGLLITRHFGVDWFGSRISSISITDRSTTDRSLGVQLQGTQLTTTWGSLKRFE